MTRNTAEGDCATNEKVLAANQETGKRDLNIFYKRGKMGAMKASDDTQISS
jgi:hypothetical protein